MTLPQLDMLGAISRRGIIDGGVFRCFAEIFYVYYVPYDSFLLFESTRSFHNSLIHKFTSFPCLPSFWRQLLLPIDV